MHTCNIEKVGIGMGTRLVWDTKYCISGVLCQIHSSCMGRPSSYSIKVPNLHWNYVGQSQCYSLFISWERACRGCVYPGCWLWIVVTSMHSAEVEVIGICNYEVLVVTSNHIFLGLNNLLYMYR